MWLPPLNIQNLMKTLPAKVQIPPDGTAANMHESGDFPIGHMVSIFHEDNLGLRKRKIQNSSNRILVSINRDQSAF